jgi:tetratricopeptide (TPR) repeat protein
VFINYRGEDSHSYGALLYTELVRRFGDEQVFLDCESIPAGADFVEELLGRVRSARVVLAMIGPRWLIATDTTGQRRIDNPDDWIRRELAEAFTAGVRVIPVLTEQITMPAAAELPADIAALSRCQYRRLRHHDPTADLARIVTDLISLDPALAAAACSRDGVPRQLPAAPGLFTGRASELATLTAAATTTPDTAETTVVISAIGGGGGIGKTALALHWAHQHLHRFPDGQLYINLRGFDPSGHPTLAGEAVRGFLDALGVDPAELPVGLDAQTARYRSLVAGKRMLIVLDNARDIDQVTPLLPGHPTCTVLVTSRRRLAGLATLHDARLLDLYVLPTPDARQLLARHLGNERLAAEPQAVTELLAICAGLPLAVRIVAVRAEQHSDFPLTVLTEELRDVSARLDGLDAGDLQANLRAVLSWSGRTLGAQASSLFGLLGIAPGPDISLPAAASLAALTTRQTRAVLRELEHASLIQQHAPGRYRMHDLLRVYAAERTTTDETDHDRAAAIRRVLAWYLHTATAAGRALDCGPTFDCQPRQALLGSAETDHTPPVFTTHDHALAWFKTEHANLVAAVGQASDFHQYDIAWKLPIALSHYFDVDKPAADWMSVHNIGLAAAQHLRNRRGEAAILADLAGVHQHFEQFDESLGCRLNSLAAFREINDQWGEALSLCYLGRTYHKLGQLDHAVDNLQQSLNIWRSQGDRLGEAMTFNCFGGALRDLQQHHKALTHHQQALTIYREIGLIRGEGDTLYKLGLTYQQLRRHQKAIDCLRQAVAIFRQINTRRCAFRRTDAEALRNLGNLLYDDAQMSAALEYWRQALAIYKDLDDPQAANIAARLAREITR